MVDTFKMGPYALAMKNTTNAAAWFYGQSFHGAAEQTAPKPSLVTAVAPSIERSSGGWYTVHGGEHGPVDRYGRDSAEQTLAAVVAARAQKGA